MVPREGLEPPSRPNLDLAVYKAAALPLSYRGKIKLLTFHIFSNGLFYITINKLCIYKKKHYQTNNNHKMVVAVGIEPRLNVQNTTLKGGSRNYMALSGHVSL